MINVSFRKRGVPSVRLLVALALVAFSAGAADICLTEKEPVRGRVDDPREDLCAGFQVSAQVRFDADPATWGQMTILQKGVNDRGSYILRVDGPKEGTKFSFFVNVDGSPEPRVSVPIHPTTGVWYRVNAGWDGTNAWLDVNGQRASKRRVGTQSFYPYSQDAKVGPLRGVVRDLTLAAPIPSPVDTALRPGTRFACDVTFLKPPKGETTILRQGQAYWLRYDDQPGHPPAFTLFVNIDGGWEPRTSKAMPVEVGRTYSLVGGWNGREVALAVDHEQAESVRRVGRRARDASSLAFGPKAAVRVSRFAIRNEAKPLVRFGQFRTRELVPREGQVVTLKGSVGNLGSSVGACVVAAQGRDGVVVTPAQIAVPALGENEEIPLAWQVDPGTNVFARIDFTVRHGDTTLVKTGKRVVLMPVRDPELSARAWTPPIRPQRTYHLDADQGDDAHDGLSPATAWKTCARAAAVALGPGDRLLLKRGCVFHEELIVSNAVGCAANWAEIGAYGEGMRPVISRRRHMNDRCVHVLNAAYVVVRDLTVCNAGAGLAVVCDLPGSGHVLFERCLAHHIEGTYRFNAHGIPEWWDEPGPSGGRSFGFSIEGARPNHIVMRDCESYQCSSGFMVRGTDTFTNRMFCHDNYAHNTSPHPYNCGSRTWITDCVFDASGWHASAGTMGIMLANNDGWIIRGCHFLNQPDSGSPDQGGIDFEAEGENCLVDQCTFRNNAGAAIEVLGLIKPQARNVHIRGCRFDRNNWRFKNGPAEIQVWGGPHTSTEVACSNGRIENNGYVLVPGVPFYVNNSPTTNDWELVGNRAFDFASELNAAFPYPDPPQIAVCGEVWTDRADAALSATVDDPKAMVAWEQYEGPSGVRFAKPAAACTKATFPGEGDYRVTVKADNGTLWRAAHTAVHILPAGARTFHAWDFAKNLDTQGWRTEGTGTSYQFIPGKVSFWSTESFPVQLVCGDYYVIAVKNSGTAAIVTPDDRDVGVCFDAKRANAVRIKMQNHTTSTAMRLWWQTDGTPSWDETRSVVFAVDPLADDDRVYTIPMPQIGTIKQFKLSFAADGQPVTGTVRIDYIWCGSL